MKYQSGFGNDFSTEAVSGALPIGRNAPQKAPYGLYAEQLNGSAFTAVRGENRRTWLYRIQPSVTHGAFKKITQGALRSSPFTELDVTPNQLRWDPLPKPKKSCDFLDGLHTMVGNGDSATQVGCAIHIYSFDRDMESRYFYNADGEMVFVPQSGSLLLKTEMGHLEISPKEIAVIPRGVKFQVMISSGKHAYGYLCENYGAPFRLPNLGPIGANGLAQPRDFLAPTAAYEERKGKFGLVCKLDGKLWSAPIDHSPLDVVAWHGNLTPYKYDLTRFNTIGTVSFDHPDPSIFTVLTSPSDPNGTANIDFVIFPPRWMVGEDTFRPPYYHRNLMSEFMGNIHGVYDAKEEGFVPGGASLHNCMSSHGPEAAVFEKASNAHLKPTFLGDTLSFMFESRYLFRPTQFAMETKSLQKNYQDCWKGLEAKFKKPLKR